jgi:hypothetical protein
VKHGLPPPREEQEQILRMPENRVLRTAEEHKKKEESGDWHFTSSTFTKYNCSNQIKNVEMKHAR